MIEDVELVGVVAEDHGHGEEAMRQDRAQKSAFGSDTRGIGVGFEFAHAEPTQMRAPSLSVGEAALAVGREPSRQGRWHVLLTHIGERLVVDDIIREPGAQAFEEVHAALRIGRPEPGEAVVADLRADRVAPLVARPGIIDADPGCVRKSGAQDIARFLDEGLVIGDQQARQLPLGDFDPDREQLREQAGRGDLSLMVLAEHETAQLGAEMAFDAGRHFRHQLAPIRRQPTFAPIAHHALTKHQLLNDVILIALEYRARRQARDLDDPLFVDRAIGRLGAAASARLASGRLLTVRLLHPGRSARRLDIGSALQALQPQYLRALLDDGPAQSRNLAKQLLNKSLELIEGQRISIEGIRHSENESGIRVLGNPPPPI